MKKVITYMKATDEKTTDEPMPAWARIVLALAWLPLPLFGWCLAFGSVQTALDGDLQCVGLGVGATAILVLSYVEGAAIKIFPPSWNRLMEAADDGLNRFADNDFADDLARRGASPEFVDSVVYGCFDRRKTHP